MAGTLYPDTQVFKNDGSVNAAGEMEFFIPGTATQKAIYTDSDLLVQHANPVVLDAAGRPPTTQAIFLDGDYDVVIRDSLSNTLATIDNINPALTTTAGDFNKVQNGSFESSVAGVPESWELSPALPDGTVATDTTDSTHGSNSLKFTSLGNGGGTATQSAFFEVSPLRDVSVKFAIKSSVVDVRNIFRVLWFDTSKVSVGSATIYDNATSNPLIFTDQTGDATPPSTARFAKVEIVGCDASDPTPGSTHFDNIEVVDGGGAGVGYPLGAVSAYPLDTAPAGFRLCDGSALLATDFEDLFDLVVANVGDWGTGTSVGTATFADATDIITVTAHGKSDNDVVHFTTSGTLPTNINANTKYYIINSTVNTFQVSLTRGGTAVDFTGAGSGTHTLHDEFNLPDMRGRTALGKDDLGGTPANRVTSTQADNLGQGTGVEDFTQTESTLGSHAHAAGSPESPGSGATGRLTAAFGFDTEVVGGAAAINVMNPYQTHSYIIKVQNTV